MSREIAISLLLFLIYIQSFASGFELKKLLKNEKLSLNDDVLNIEQHGKAILSRGDSSSAEDDSDEVQKDFEIMGDVIKEWIKDEINVGDVGEEFEEMLEEVKVEGYKFYHNRGCIEHDEIFNGQFDESDIDECKNICDKDETCISFEYWGQGNPDKYRGEGICHASTTCTSKMAQPKSVNNMTCNLYVKGEKDNWDVIEDDDDKSAGNVVGIGNEEEDEHDIEEYGHVLESGNKDVDKESDNSVEENVDVVESGNGEKDENSDNSVDENSDVAETANGDENDNTDNFADMISNEIENSNDEENDDSDNSKEESKETCKDGIKNQDEVGIDCGGSCPELCGANFNDNADANWAAAQNNVP